MSLKEKLDGRKEEFKKQAPPEAQEIMHKATEDLRNSGIADRALKVGARGFGFVFSCLNSVIEIFYLHFQTIYFNIKLVDRF